MSDQFSSLPAANSARAEWRRFFAFLKRPRLPERAAGISGRSLVGVLRMLGLDLMITLGLVIVAIGVMAVGFELPGNTLAELEFGPGVVALIVLGAPLFEETAFRGWLSGRPGHVVPLLLLALGLLAGPLLFADQQMLALAAAGAAILAAIASAWLLRGRSPFGWFARFFPLFLAVSTVGFALVHLANYQEGTLPVLLPLVIPQLVLGAVLGYVRVTYGLWSSMLLHALHNGCAVGVILLAESLAG